jgi:hypothetical protein
MASSKPSFTLDDWDKIVKADANKIIDEENESCKLANIIDDNSIELFFMDLYDKLINDKKNYFRIDYQYNLPYVNELYKAIKNNNIINNIPSYINKDFSIDKIINIVCAKKYKSIGHNIRGVQSDGTYNLQFNVCYTKKN